MKMNKKQKSEEEPKYVMNTHSGTKAQDVIIDDNGSLKLGKPKNCY